MKDEKRSRKLAPPTKEELMQFFIKYNYDARNVFVMRAFREVLSDQPQLVMHQLFDREIKIIRDDPSNDRWKKYYHRKCIIKMCENAAQAYLEMHPYVKDGVITEINNALVFWASKGWTVDECLSAISEILNVPISACNCSEVRNLVTEFLES